MYLKPVSAKTRFLQVDSFDSKSLESAYKIIKCPRYYDLTESLKLKRPWNVRYPLFFSSGGSISATTKVLQSDLSFYKAVDATVIPNQIHITNGCETYIERFSTTKSFSIEMAKWGKFFGFDNVSRVFNLEQAEKLPNDWQKGFIPDESSDYLLVSNDPNDQNFTHWFLGPLRLLWLSRYEINKLRNPALLFSYQPKQWQIDSLSLFLDIDIKIEIKVFRVALSPKTLYFIGVQQENCFDFDYFKHLSSFRRHTGGNNQLCDDIFINRSDANTRRISNFDQLLPLIKQHGYKVVTMTEMNLENQIAMVARARRIIFIGGSHGMLLVFASKSAKIGIVLNEDYSGEDWDHWLAIPNNFGSPVSEICWASSDNRMNKTNNSDIIIDINRFRDFLTKLSFSQQQ